MKNNHYYICPGHSIILYENPEKLCEYPMECFVEDNIFETVEEAALFWSHERNAKNVCCEQNIPILFIETYTKKSAQRYPIVKLLIGEKMGWTNLEDEAFFKLLFGTENNNDRK